jgi:hypothetical protein
MKHGTKRDVGATFCSDLEIQEKILGDLMEDLKGIMG